MIDDPNNASADANVYVRGGGLEVFTNFNAGTNSYAADKQTLAVLARTSATTYEKQFPDGSKEVFSLSDGSNAKPRRIFLTSIVDPRGNAVSLSYDSSLRITAITDAAGQSTSVWYEMQSDPLKITKVTDPFGRFAQFDYMSGQLTKITDPVGIQSQFFYDTGSDFINRMRTPYGDTTFAHGENGDATSWLEATDPLLGKERVEYNDAAPGIASFESQSPNGVQNSFLDSANTFYWDKKAMADAPGDYSKARVIHWLKSADGTVSGIKHSEKRAFESRVWYSYVGQTDGGTVGTNARYTQVARILDDATTKSSQYLYNSLGNLTQSIDAVRRKMTYDYDTNGIDLLYVQADDRLE